MKRLIVALLAASAIASPALAQNDGAEPGRQWRAPQPVDAPELRERRQEFRQERRENQQGARELRQEMREDRGEALREFRQERREDRVDALRARAEMRAGQAEAQQRGDWRSERRDWNQSGRDRADDRGRGDGNDGRRGDWNDGRRGDWNDGRRGDWNDGRRGDWDGRRRGDWNDGRRDGWDDRRRGDWSRNGQFGDWNQGWRRDPRYNWQDWRYRNRGQYRLPPYSAPRGWGFGYRRFSPGIVIAPSLFARNYWIADPWAYRLPPAYGPYRWVRYFGDVLLVDLRTGRVVDAIPDFFW
jgi:hypothetical protein